MLKNWQKYSTFQLENLRYLSYCSSDKVKKVPLWIGYTTVPLRRGPRVPICSVYRLLTIIKSRTRRKEIEINPEKRQLISDWAFMAEKIMHGTPSGIKNLNNYLNILFFIFKIIYINMIRTSCNMMYSSPPPPIGGFRGRGPLLPPPEWN